MLLVKLPPYDEELMTSNYDQHDMSMLVKLEEFFYDFGSSYLGATYNTCIDYVGLILQNLLGTDYVWVTKSLNNRSYLFESKLTDLRKADTIKKKQRNCK